MFTVKEIRCFPEDTWVSECPAQGAVPPCSSPQCTLTSVGPVHPAPAGGPARLSSALSSPPQLLQAPASQLCVHLAFWEAPAGLAFLASCAVAAPAGTFLLHPWSLQASAPRVALCLSLGPAPHTRWALVTHTALPSCLSPVTWFLQPGSGLIFWFSKVGHINSTQQLFAEWKRNLNW